MRWTALGVDYEMAGKDLIESVTLSSRICKALGGTPPEGFNYELFLDDKGEKISKSRGNGLTIDEWLRYASPESLSLFMFQKPKSAKRLYFDVIPRAVDEYLQLLAAYPAPGRQGEARQCRLAHPRGQSARRRHAGDVRADAQPRRRLERRRQGRAVGLHSPSCDRASARRRIRCSIELAGYAVRYYEDFVKPNKKYRRADEVETAALRALSDALESAARGATAEDLQGLLYDVGRSVPRYQDPNAKGATPERPGVSNAWFNAIYEVLLGEEKGPRFGSFIELYGVKETRALIDKALNGELTKAA